MSAALALQPHEAVGKDPTPQEGLKLTLHMGGEVAPFRFPVADKSSQNVLLDRPVKKCLRGITRTVRVCSSVGSMNGCRDARIGESSSAAQKCERIGLKSGTEAINSDGSTQNAH